MSARASSGKRTSPTITRSGRIRRVSRINLERSNAVPLLGERLTRWGCERDSSGVSSIVTIRSSAGKRWASALRVVVFPLPVLPAIIILQSQASALSKYAMMGRFQIREGRSCVGWVGRWVKRRILTSIEDWETGAIAAWMRIPSSMRALRMGFSPLNREPLSRAIRLMSATREGVSSK